MHVSVGQLIHADKCSLKAVPSAGVYHYFVVFKDDYSKYCHVYFMKEKSEAALKLSQMLAETRTIGHTVKQLLS